VSIRRRLHGATLLEILIAVTFLAICSTAILQTVLTADTQASYAMRRSQILAALQSKIETVRGMAESGSLTEATTTETLNLQGIANPVTLVTVLALRTNSISLWDLTVTATWADGTSLGSRSDSASLTTVVKDR
jgi:Tfp pilus assembly protein PilV